MRLPRPLVRLRSALAQALGRVLRLGYPVNVRALRFLYEVRARALLRGRVAAGVQFVGPIVVDGTGQVDIGAGTRVGRGVTFETYGDARIEIGENVTLNDGTVLCAYAGIAIGDDTMCGEYACIRDANHGTATGVPVRMQPATAKSVTIGRDVWIGRAAAVLRGVRLGDGAIVGANSVVTRDIPAGTIAAGVPARPIGERKA